MFVGKKGNNINCGWISPFCILIFRHFESYDVTCLPSFATELKIYFCNVIKSKIQHEIDSKSNLKWLKSNSIPFPKLLNTFLFLFTTLAVFFFLKFPIIRRLKYKTYLFQDGGQIFWSTNDQNVVCSNFRQNFKCAL